MIAFKIYKLKIIKNNKITQTESLNISQKVTEGKTLKENSQKVTEGKTLKENYITGKYGYKCEHSTCD